MIQLHQQVGPKKIVHEFLHLLHPHKLQNHKHQFNTLLLHHKVMYQLQLEEVSEHFHLYQVKTHLQLNQHENIEKGMFYCITFLNFLNNDQGIPTDPKKIKAILEWPTPLSIREIWGFHDLINFYKRFVPYFSILVAPLIELVRNHIPSWEDAQEKGF